MSLDGFNLQLTFQKQQLTIGNWVYSSKSPTPPFEIIKALAAGVGLAASRLDILLPLWGLQRLLKKSNLLAEVFKPFSGRSRLQEYGDMLDPFLRSMQVWYSDIIAAAKAR
jgi:hypothetical protein